MGHTVRYASQLNVPARRDTARPIYQACGLVDGNTNSRGIDKGELVDDTK